jgi:transcriptional pleiotropic regulator of transition state genes
MWNCGGLRSVDNLGRVVLPKSIREEMEIQVGDTVDIVACGDGIMVRPCKLRCRCCGEFGKNLVEVNKLWLCRNCVKQFGEEL